MTFLIEMTSELRPADGSAPRTITIRIADLRHDPEDELWSVAVEVLGFDPDYRVRLKGADWLHASIDGTMGFIRRLAGGLVQDDGGTISPTLLPRRDPESTGVTPAGGWLRPPVEQVPEGPRGAAILEMASVFTPAGGGAPQTVTVRASDLQPEPDGAWSVLVDVVGFEPDEHVRVKGADWVNALDGVALFLREGLGRKVKESGGTLTPELLPP